LLIDAARPARHLAGDRWFVDETSVKVCGVWSGLAGSHGHRQANEALYRVVIVRMQHHEPAKAYAARTPPKASPKPTSSAA
jgi:hypothetical protein